jgi:hypothetical protein
VLPFAVANFLVAPLGHRVGPGDPGAEWVFVCMGAIGAEGALHAIWCVLAPLRFAKRLAVGVQVGLALYCAWALGLAVVVSRYGQPDGDYWEILVIGLACLPLPVIASQSPLWLARIWLGWRVAHRGDPSGGSDVEPFRIRDLLAAIGVVALALSAPQLPVLDDARAREVLLLGLATCALMAGGISLLTTLAVVVATLRPRRAWVGLLALAPVLLLALAIPVGFVATMSEIEEVPIPTLVYVNAASLGASYFVCLAGVMLVVRGLGYRLVWGRRRAVRGSPDPSACCARVS